MLPSGFTAAQKTTAIELHALDWCPRASAAVINERQVKRRRLDCMERTGCPPPLHSRWKEASDTIWPSSCDQLVTPCSNFFLCPTKCVQGG
uniref:Uncharacterized protein n=1 Tax=Loa loa TaxID=7209 RepID=A0A1I7VZ89_LOALO